MPNVTLEQATYDWFDWSAACLDAPFLPYRFPTVENSQSGTVRFWHPITSHPHSNSEIGTGQRIAPLFQFASQAASLSRRVAATHPKLAPLAHWHICPSILALPNCQKQLLALSCERVCESSCPTIPRQPADAGAFVPGGNSSSIYPSSFDLHIEAACWYNWLVGAGPPSLQQSTPTYYVWTKYPYLCCKAQRTCVALDNINRPCENHHLRIGNLDKSSCEE